LRNLAELLRRIGDDEPAATIDQAADHAPDAPAVPFRRVVAAQAVSRTEVLAVARAAIARNLSTR
jgi:hypothetical protein